MFLKYILFCDLELVGGFCLFCLLIFLVFSPSGNWLSSLFMNFLYVLVQHSVSIGEQLLTIPFILPLKEKKNQTGIVSIAASFAFQFPFFFTCLHTDTFNFRLSAHLNYRILMGIEGRPLWTDQHHLRKHSLACFIGCRDSMMGGLLALEVNMEQSHLN